MPQELEWTIYYADDCTFSNLDGPPQAAPGYGVLRIWQKVGESLFNETYYFWHEVKQSWLNVDFIGLVDWLVIDAPNITAVKVGRTVPVAEFKALMRRVNEEHA